MTVPATMRAAWYERTGPARDVFILGETDTPTPRANEVLVAVAAAGVNPHDTKRRSGWIALPLPQARNIPGSDGAGTIAAVGPGVDLARIGERVWLSGGAGTAAEYVTVRAENAVALPDGVTFDVGASLGVPAITAHDAVFSDGPVTGQNVLVQGGAGAVAAYAIQFARWNGARVIATVSSVSKAELAVRLGADAVVDYRRQDVVAAVHAFTGGGAGVDRIIEVDLGANLAVDAAVIAPNGVIASYSSTRNREPVLRYYDLAFKGVTLRLVQGLVLPPARRTQAVRDITALLRRGQLQHPPVTWFPLAEIAAAHDALESGAVIGKVLVTMA